MRKYFSIQVEVLVLLIGLLMTTSAVRGNTNIVFPDDNNSPNRRIVPPEEISDKSQEVKPKFGFNNGGVSATGNFGLQQTQAGVSASGSFSSSYGHSGANNGHSGSQSQSFNFNAGNGGFSGTQSASQASAFNAQFPGYHGHGTPSFSGSQASSQSSGLSGSAAGVFGSQASSQSSGFSGNFGNAFPGGGNTVTGTQANSQSSVTTNKFHQNPYSLLTGFTGSPYFPPENPNWSNIPPEFIRSRRPFLGRSGKPQQGVYSQILVSRSGISH